MGVLFKNNAVSVLAGSLTTVSTDILIDPADDGKFPIIAAMILPFIPIQIMAIFRFGSTPPCPMEPCWSCMIYWAEKLQNTLSAAAKTSPISAV